VSPLKGDQSPDLKRGGDNLIGQRLTPFELGIRLDLPPLSSASGFAAPIKRLNDCGLLLFKGMAADPQALLAMARGFGDLEDVRPPEHRLGHFVNVRLQSNIEGVGVRGGGTYWHADSPWYDPPAAATLLLCVEAPDQGGETTFVDMRAALRALPPDLRSCVDSAIGHYPCRQIIDAEYIADPVLVGQMHDIKRPLIRRHPVDGTPALYLNEKWLACIDGLEAAQSGSVLRRLYAFVDDFEQRYTHRWEPGDLLVWDNSVVCHKASPSCEGSRKITWRVIARAFPSDRFH